MIATVRYPARTFEVGEVLPNGKIVLAVRNADAFNDGYVLVMIPGNSIDKYVTWRVSMSTGEFYLGRYMDSLTMAVKDFNNLAGVTA
jgi:hypothetical protein